MKIPRNIRQIGDIETSLRLYIEDYVATFIEKVKRKGGTGIGILLGTQETEGETPCLFIRGAVLAKDYETEDGRVIMTASAWNAIYEEAENYFKDVEICGWFLCSEDQELTDFYNLKKSHRENFKSTHQVLLLYNGERDEETVYCFEAQESRRLRGYYIYYERNEQMQEYMISKEPIKKTEFTLVPATRGISDDAARQFRTIMETKQGAKQGTRSGTRLGTKAETKQEIKKERKPGTGAGSQEEKNGISRFLRTVSVTALLCGAGFGLASWYKYDGFRGMKDVIAVMAGTGGGNDSKSSDGTGMNSGERGAEESGQAVIKEVPGGVYPSESATDETGQSSTADQNNGVENVGGTDQSNSTAGGSSTDRNSSTAGSSTDRNSSTAGSSTDRNSSTAGSSTDRNNSTAGNSTEGSTSGENRETPAETGAQAAAGYREYVVKSGDTLYNICKKLYGKGDASLVETICELNGMDNADFIFEGQTLKLPQ